MKTRSWIGIGTLLSLALVAQAADTPSQLPGRPAPPPAPALEAPPAPALETPAPAQDTPSPIAIPETPARAIPAPTNTTPAVPPPAPARRPQVETAVPLSGHGMVKEDRVNLRSRAVLNSEVVGQLNKGDQVEVMEQISIDNPKAGEPAQWIKLALPKTNFVWVNSKFIDLGTRTVKATRLNVRSGPSENHDVLGRLDKGASIREVEAQGEWLKIPAPSGSYAYVASFLIDKGSDLAGRSTPPPVADPTPAIPPPGTPVTPMPLESAGGTVAPLAAEPAPTTAEPEVKPTEPQLIKRIVSREGIVRRTVSIQAPTEFALENPETRKMVNYLFNPPASGVVLRNFEGQRILVTGEELLDDRWPNTPVMNIEKIKARP